MGRPLDRHIVPAIVEGCDFGVVPLVAEPLRKPADLSRSAQLMRRHSSHDAIAFVGFCHAHVRDGARWQFTDSRHELVGIVANRQSLDLMTVGRDWNLRFEFFGVGLRHAGSQKHWRHAVGVVFLNDREKSDEEENPQLSAMEVREGGRERVIRDSIFRGAVASQSRRASRRPAPERRGENGKAIGVAGQILDRN